MWRSLCLLSTSLLLALGGCSDDTCGPGGAAADGLVASASGVTLTYGAMDGGLNNYCPDPAAPAGVVSLTVHGTQTDGTGQITLCIPRPDTISKQTMPLGPDVSSGTDVRLVDLEGMAAGCAFTLGNTVTGTVKTSGLCGNGADNAGFALTIDATVQLDRACMTDTIDVQLAGTIAVATAQ